MRQFTANYLEHARAGLWEDSRAALKPLNLNSRAHILDVGAGSGELSTVLRAESNAPVTCMDADKSLLKTTASTSMLTPVLGDAYQLPFKQNSFELVICQALLVNLQNPAHALRQFADISIDHVAAIEPDNRAVNVASTVESEVSVEHRARTAYIAGVETDITLGSQLTDLFSATGLQSVNTRTQYHYKVIEPPYSETEFNAAARKASGRAISEKKRELQRVLSVNAYDQLRNDWRAMGREVVNQMQSDSYRRTEVVPYTVAVGTVSEDM